MSGADGTTLTGRRVDRDVPYGLTVAAAWSWRIVLVLIMVGVAWWLLSHVSLLVIPLLVAALLSTLMSPLFLGLRRVHVPGVVAALTCVLVLVAFVTGLLYFTGQALVTGFVDLAEQISEIFVTLQRWGQDAGMDLTWASAASALSVDTVIQALRENSSTIMGGAISFGSTATNLAVGVFLTLFALIFFLYDGSRIWRFLLVFVPRAHRRALDHAGAYGWRALGQYVRVQILVAFIDAVGIGLGAWALGVPLAFPLAVLVFLGAFIPMVGATLTGALAVLLALLANGWLNALLMLAVVLVVQQLESNVLQPIVMGRAVSLHPLAVFLAVTGGTAVWGLVGAVFIVPILAFVNAFVRGLRQWQLKDAGVPTGSHGVGQDHHVLPSDDAVFDEGPVAAPPAPEQGLAPAAADAAADIGLTTAADPASGAGTAAPTTDDHAEGPRP